MSRIIIYLCGAQLIESTIPQHQSPSGREVHTLNQLVYCPARSRGIRSAAFVVLFTRVNRV